jgi:hypothetical protein
MQGRALIRAYFSDADPAIVMMNLLTYVLLRLVGPTGIGATFALSLWTGVVSDWAAKRQWSKQKLV